MMNARTGVRLCRLIMTLALGGAGSAAAETRALPDGAAINVKDFGAKGDGRTDDTAAIKKAFVGTYSAWEQIYLPAGTYLLSGPIDIGRFQTLRGDGPDKTVLKLQNNATGYADKDHPSWVLRSWRGCCADDQGDNTTHSVHIMNLAVDVGSGNPGAIGINFIAHNGGGLENVLVRAAAGSGTRGVALERNSPGPFLINRLTVEGFDYGIAAKWGAYGVTFEDVTLNGQKVAGLHNDGQILSIRHLVSNNSVPAIQSTTTDFGMLVLLDSRLSGGSASQVAIESTGAAYVRNLCTSGYQAPLRDGSKPLPGDTVAEYASQTIEQGAPSPDRSLDLPITDMIVPEWDDPASWANVNDYNDHVKNGDWGPAIQAAIDSGKTTIYFPNRTNPAYNSKTDIHVRGAVRRIIGLSASIGGGKLVFDNDDATATIYVEQFRDAVIEHRAKAKVVIRRSMGGPLSTFPGAGDLFVEDWCCGNFDIDHSNVWVRQLNEESMTTKLHNRGGHLWVLEHRSV